MLSMRVNLAMGKHMKGAAAFSVDRTVRGFCDGTGKSICFVFTSLSSSLHCRLACGWQRFDTFGWAGGSATGKRRSSTAMYHMESPSLSQKR